VAGRLSMSRRSLRIDRAVADTETKWYLTFRFLKGNYCLNFTWATITTATNGDFRASSYAKPIQMTNTCCWASRVS